MSKVSNESAIDYFFGDSNVQRLVTSTAMCQPLRICYPKEVNVSRFLAWLLDPTQGHGLGDLAIQSLLTRAWWNCADAEISIATRRFLSPANIQTEGFSSAVVTTEVDLGGTSLDVLVIDATRRRYIAIENKFGSQQSKSQLSGYRRELEKLFPDFLSVNILLDSNEADPEDGAWISIGYTWLAEFLREIEQRDATADHVKTALLQFRSVIEDEAEDSMASSQFGRLVTEVAGGHPEVFELMSVWSQSAKGGRARVLRDLISEAGTLEGKSVLRLFQLYWRRTSVWDQCIKQAQFAPFVFALRQRFQDVLVDPKRVRTGFSLQQWESLVDREQFDSWFYPAYISVKKTGDNFEVISLIQLNSVRADKRDALIEAAEQIRKISGGKYRKMRDEQSSVVLRRVKGLSQKRAIDEMVLQCVALQTALAPMC